MASRIFLLPVDAGYTCFYTLWFCFINFVYTGVHLYFIQYMLLGLPNPLNFQDIISITFIYIISVTIIVVFLFLQHYY